MYVSLGIFTQYRRELMGVATVLILLCHSLLPPAIHCPNDILRWIIITGNRGVDIFLFLSGLGMYHSLRKMTKWNRGGEFGGMQKDTGTFYYLIYSFASPTTWYWVV